MTTKIDSPKVTHDENQSSSVIHRLEDLEQKLTLVQGFVQKLFGNNFEEYCREKNQMQVQVKKQSSKSDELKSSSSSQVPKARIIVNDLLLGQNTEHKKRNGEEEGIQFSNLSNLDKVLTTEETSVVPMEAIARSIVVNSYRPSAPPFNHNNHTVDPLMNPFLESGGDETDPIAIGDDPITATSISQSAESPAENVDGSTRSSEEAAETSRGESMEQTGQQELDYQIQNTNRLYFFDDGVDQGQFEYFEEEDVEPFHPLEEETDIKILTTTDMQGSSSFSFSSELCTTTPPSSSNKLADWKPVKIKLEHGQETVDSGNRKSRPKRASASYPSSSNTLSRKRKSKGDDTDNDDSDFKLESDDENSSSSSESDPDWKSMNTTTKQHQTITLPAKRGQSSKVNEGGGPPTNKRMTVVPKLSNIKWLNPLHVNAKIPHRAPRPVPKILALTRYKNPIQLLPKVINGVYFRLVSLSTDKNNQHVMIVKAKCSICATTQTNPVIILGYGKSNRTFMDHLEMFHTAYYNHYKANAQMIDAATTKLRDVISKQTSTNNGTNSEAFFVSQHLRKITSLGSCP